MQKIILTVAAIFIFISSVSAQANKDELQKQRQQLRKEIEETERVLNQTKKTTKENLGQLSLINKRLDLQGNVIQNITGQLKFIENDIYKSQREVNKLARILDTLKREYAISMVYAYKNRNSYDFLNFIFSASSFNDAIKRITYLKSYRSYREQQGENIVRTQQLLQQRINELSGNKQKKNVALQEKSKEMTVLEKQQAEKEKIVVALKGRQKELTAQVNNKKRQDAKLRNMISDMIKREIAIARKKAESDKAERDRLARLNNKTNNNDVAVTKPSVTKVPKKAESVLVSSEADRVLDASFERNRGSLPWPADGIILSHYGRNELPGGIDWIENGVTIGTAVGGNVKAIFDGEVTLVNDIEGNRVVYIKHGKYFSVYSHLSSATVNKGQTVKTGQVVGKAAVNDDGQGETNLIIMKEMNNVNPEQYLRRK
ncbi:MAG TPA: peptidoglycan DD-metalloendopeptidase family protein [Chitinophagaceae bacterium]|nr:peptidoglycan DD-metalloendopeptidase family protein [Chitinophagaceae bacterium]